MHPKIKNRPTGEKAMASIVRPLVLHEVANPAASAQAASCRPIRATQPASGTPDHARHHVARQTQA